MPESPDPHPSLRAYVDLLGGPRNFGKRHNLAHRTAERIYSGEKPCPPGLLAEIRQALTGAAQEPGQ